MREVPERFSAESLTKVLYTIADACQAVTWSFTFGSHQSCQQHSAMKPISCVFKPLRLSSKLEAIRRNEFWHSQQPRLRCAMSTMAMPVLRKQKDDGSGKLWDFISRYRNILAQLVQ